MNTLKGFTKVLFALLLVAVLAINIQTAAAQSNNVTLSFDSLPSSQPGWFYLNDTLPWLSKQENEVFSLVGNLLHMNTLFGINTNGTWNYEYPLSTVIDTPFALIATARINTYGDLTVGPNAYGFCISVVTGSMSSSIGISPGQLEGELGTVLSTSVDVTQMHTYRLEVNPGVDYEVFVDNVSVGTAPVRDYTGQGTPDHILIGDCTRGAAADVDIASLSLVTQQACYIDAPPSVYEGSSFTATVKCDDGNDVYGFQLGTSSSGSASSSTTSYTPGTFVTDVGSDYLEASNTLSNYSVSRRAPATAASGNFSLGSLDYTADTGLTADSSVTLSLDSLLLGDISGAPLSASTTPTTTVDILDLLTLNLTVASDGNVQQVRNVTASIDSSNRGPQTNPGRSVTFNFADEIATVTPVLTADMVSHLACSGALNLTSSVTDLTIHLKAGDVVLNGADPTPRINLFDAVTIALALGTPGSGEEDVNGDGTVNIFDLIHVGRNYGTVMGACS